MTESITVNLAFLSRDLNLAPAQTEAVVELLDQGYPIPFIARYRKDVTQNLDEEHIRMIALRLKEQRALAERKETILRSIESLEKLTPELEKKIISARTPRRLEDLYLPYKPKKQTLASTAREKGLEPLADEILNASPLCADLQKRAADYINSEKGVTSAEEAILGAGHIISEIYSEDVELRQRIHEIFQREGKIVSQKIEVPSDVAANDNQPAVQESSQQNAQEVNESASDSVTSQNADNSSNTAESPVSEPQSESAETSAETEGTTAIPQEGQKNKAKKGKKKHKKNAAEQKSEQEEKLYSDYFNFTSDLRHLPAYRILAINRGEREKVLRVKLEVNENQVQNTASKTVIPEDHAHKEYLTQVLADALNRLVLPSIERGMRREMTENAEKQGVKVFAKNLRNLLLQKPLFRRRVLAVDPGFRYGCKLVALDEFGNFLAYDSVYITGNAERKRRAVAKITEMVEKYKISMIAIGNGTGCREAEEIVAGMITEKFSDREIAYIIVNEAGASVYSVSQTARDEFPRYDALMRGAVSIGRRLQNPLNELVKIEPASLGVGIYQHDLKAKRLKESLAEVVESCVNYVGVDLNSATDAILKYVAGLNKLTAKRIFEYRTANGPFRYREDLKKVSGLGDAAFTHAAGFLKIADGYEPLDSTWIHPESYPLAEKILEKIGFQKEDLRKPEKRSELTEKLNALDPAAIAEEFAAGPMTVADIFEQLKRPGLDPRDAFPAPIFKKGVMTLDNLAPGMELRGTVLNVVDFGAFVDIGLHDSGLVHISRMGDRFVRDAHECVAVGDVVKVWVVALDKDRHRISLSMIEPGTENKSTPKAKRNDSEGQAARENASQEGRRPRRREDSARPSGERADRGNRRDRSSSDKSEHSSEKTPNKSWHSDHESSRSGQGRRDYRFDSRDRAPRTMMFESKIKKEKKISEEMKQGKEPLRSFSDLAQLLGRSSDTDNQDEKTSQK